MAGDDAEELENVSEVGLVAAALALKGQQEVLPAADPTALVLVDHVHEEEGEDADVSMRQMGPDDGEHLVEGVEAVGVVRCFLRPGREAAISSGPGPVHPSPAGRTGSVGHNLVVRGSDWALTGVQLTGLNVRMDLLSRGVLGHVRGSSSMGGL